MPEKAQRCQRRAHTKSRRGCNECKRRRIKCSEEKPACQSCIRHEISCVYPNSASSSRQENRQPSKSNSPASASSMSSLSDHHLVPVPGSPLVVETNPSPGLTTNFDMKDLELLHHWTVSTSRDIVRCPQVDYCWQSLIPSIASKHPFVMHGILSIAALHLAQREENKDRLLDAIRHNNTAIQGFHENLLHITNENSEALFVSSTLNIIYVFGILGRPSRCNISAPTSGSRNTHALGTGWIPMVQGVRTVLHNVYENVRLGPLSPLLNIGNWEELDVESEPFLDDELLGTFRELWNRSGQSEMYNEVLQVLQRCYLYASQFKMMDQGALEGWGYNRGWTAPLIFLLHAPEEYFRQLEQRQPTALILYAYFGVLLHDLDDLWFWKGWGRDIVQTVDDQLGSYWQPWIKYPRQVVGLA